MQHIPSVVQPIRDCIDVPYLCGRESVPKGHEVEEWKSEQGDEILPSIQKTCFFGTLESLWDLVIKDVFDCEFPWGDFVRQAENGRLYITTDSLPSFLCDWAALESQRSDENKHINSIKVFNILQGLDRRLSYVQKMSFTLPLEIPETKDDNFETLTDKVSIGDVLILSLTVLAEALDHARKFIYKDYAKDRRLRFPRSRLATLLLLKAGWCRGEGVHLTSLKATSAYFCSFFYKQRLDQSHESCTTEKCVADNVQTGNYQTRHVSQECGCHHVAADPDANERRANLLQDGQIPIIRLGEGRSGRTHIDIMTSSDIATGVYRRYVAISHVWSHGMGNEKANSLPLCQLEKLQLLVNDLYQVEERPVPFWIDTLCVPIDPHLRNKAIALMKRSYQQAEKVLVIDNSILNVRLGQYPGEPVWRILCSPWMRRLWTFQEALFARSLHFQFGEGAIKLDHADMSRWAFDRMLVDVQASEWTKDGNEVILTRVSRWGEKSFTSFLKVKKVPDSYQKRFSIPLPRRDEILAPTPAKLNGVYYEELFLMDPIMSVASIDLAPIIPFKQANSRGIEFIINGVQRRSTSKSGDEAICIGSLLDLDVGLLARTPSTQRMKVFYLMLGKIPAYVMFGLVPRLPDHGFRWGPASYLALSKQRINLSVNKTLAFPTASGLLAQYPGFLLPRRGYLGRESDIKLVTAGGIPYRVTMVDSRIDPEDRSVEAYPVGDYAIVLSDMPTQGRRNGVPAVFAAVDKWEDGRIFCRFCRVVQVEKVQDQPFCDTVLVSCGVLPWSQQWCVA